ncbi:hypothetical protein [Pseudoalteromonas sp. T1lg10]|uniref:hypothetical protein n=1 Tax=Pseudoalteromonas sp. T1lg10 TaxID=2077093 RepID=UPI000CF714F1|nr:hypothetical protein [Pseudoalteromonas sp. T1lg10]
MEQQSKQLQQLKASILTGDIAPDCNIYNLFIHTVCTAMKRSGLGRPMIAERMNDALHSPHEHIDQAKLNKWLAPSQPSHMPMHYLPALCYAVQSMEPANVLLNPLLHRAVDQRAQMLQQHAELQLEIEERANMQRYIADTLLNGDAPQ